MADAPPPEELFALWRQQIQAGTEAWTKAVGQMASQGQAPPTPPDPAMFWRPFQDQSVAGWAQIFSQGPASPDLLAQWKKFLDDWIAAWTKALEQAMGTEAFSQALGKTLDQFLTAQDAAKQTLDKSTKATLQTLGLPTREQVIGLSRQLMDLEDRIEGLEDLLTLLGRPTAAAAAEGSRKKSAGAATKKTATKKAAAKKAAPRSTRPTPNARRASSKKRS